jgi:hypothetical protein
VLNTVNQQSFSVGIIVNTHAAVSIYKLEIPEYGKVSL